MGNLHIYNLIVMIKRKIHLLLLILIGLFTICFTYSFLCNPSVDSKRVSQALEYCKKHNMNTRVIILCDFSKHSGSRRFIVYDTKKKKVILSSLCEQGKGKGFSNISGSYCSSLGFYKVCGSHKMRIGLNCRILKGLSSTNSNAQARGILIHPYYTVSDIPTYPLPTLYKVSKGCFVISPLKYKILDRIIKKNCYKPICLYAYI